MPYNYRGARVEIFENRSTEHFVHFFFVHVSSFSRSLVLSSSSFSPSLLLSRLFKHTSSLYDVGEFHFHSRLKLTAIHKACNRSLFSESSPLLSSRLSHGDRMAQCIFIFLSNFLPHVSVIFGVSTGSGLRDWLIISFISFFFSSFVLSSYLESIQI